MLVSVSLCRDQFLQHMKQFFQLAYKVESSEEELAAASEESGCGSQGEVLSRRSVTLSCVGVGYANFSKGIM